MFIKANQLENSNSFTSALRFWSLVLLVMPFLGVAAGCNGGSYSDRISSPENSLREDFSDDEESPPPPTSTPNSPVPVPTPPSPVPTPAPGAAQKFNSAQRKIADQIISVFENNTPLLQYAYAVNLGDGRGITAGRAGFTSGTHDMLEVVERYCSVVPTNQLCTFLPRLRQVDGTGTTSGLEGLPTAWKNTASSDSRFREAQDSLVDDWYYNPAFERFKAIGLKWPVSLLCLYDAIIQHGEGGDPDGLPAMISVTSNSLGGTPKTGVPEAEWLAKFQQVRRGVLNNSHNSATRQVWRESVPRVDELSEVINSGNIQLNPNILINVWGTNFYIPQN